MKLQLYLLGLLFMMLFMYGNGVVFGRFALGAFLFAFTMPIVAQLLRMMQRDEQTKVRYLPSMIIGRGNAQQERAYKKKASDALNSTFLLWCLVGAPLILPPFMAYDYQSETLGSVAQFLAQNFDVLPQWHAAFFDIALQKAALVFLMGVGVWNAYSVGYISDYADLFSKHCGALFALSALISWEYGLFIPVFYMPELSAYNLILCGLFCVPLWVCRTNIRYFACMALCAMAMICAYISNMDSVIFYLSGWMFIASLWGRLTALSRAA